MKTKNRSDQVQILDTFPDFEEYWKWHRRSPRRVQIKAWGSEYMGKWPALRQKQIRQYQSEGFDWEQVAEKKVFPHLEQNLSSMRLARKRLLQEFTGIIHKAQLRFRDRHPITVVIYVGIGLGAGWATTYSKSPALLFGLENIAEEGWTGRAAIRGLIIHELGHLFHSFWREEAGKRFHSGPLWDLYTEGFADRFEQLAQSQGRPRRHRESGGGQWLNWCQENRRWLASEFLRRLEGKGDLRHFFGSWYEIRGHSQTGYFLGGELIEELEKRYTLKRIATLDHINPRMRTLLLDMAKGVL